jgi:hypothetical protein
MTNIPAILIVENEALVRLLGVGTFVDASFRVIEANTGDDALGLLEADSDVRSLIASQDPRTSIPLSKSNAGQTSTPSRHPPPSRSDWKMRSRSRR